MVGYEIQSVPLSMPLWRRKVERFLEANQLRLDDVDYYAIVTSPDGDEILAGGGLQGDIIKCIAVSEKLRDAHLSNRLISHLISEAAQRGHQSVKVFTKPQNRQVFESLGFRLVGEAPLAILMENGHGIEKYTSYLRSISLSSLLSPLSSKTTGVIVMNANPFTLGHRYLIEQTAQQVDRLFVIPVKEDRSLFPYSERKAMIEAACKEFPNVKVCEGSDYAISAATFPTYFLKQLSDAADTQMLLDIDLFRRHIAPALGENASVIRFVGSEPTDVLTQRYNELLQQQLPCVRVIEREQNDGTPVSASLVRKALQEGCFADAAALVLPTTIPYLLAHLACDALRQELDLTPKPGLVDRHDNGAHTDMTHALMVRSIEALRPYFVQLAQAGQQGKTDYMTISTIGKAAEKAMLAATGGVNTHRGALFALGLAVVAQGNKVTKKQSNIQQTIASLAQTFPDTKGTHGSAVVSQYQAKGALAMGRTGYEQLFNDWLPYYRGERREERGKIKTLLRIMMSLDDTNVFHRKGPDVARKIKTDAADLLTHFSEDKLQQLNEEYNQQGISPGGCADMLALTFFVNIITK